ncbi:tetratricopeptide repeat protein, partial [Candidatus Poribacteria bacterium]|nr:tetratricopeptide repeat protein [Candidatus Poribacteria bacterium]
ARYYYDRGQAKEALGQKEAAKVDFQKAKELDPDVGQ